MALERTALRLAAMLLAAGLGLGLGTGPAPGGRNEGALRDLERWTERAAGRKHPLDGEREDELRIILAQTRALAGASFDGQRSVTLALLDLYAAGIRAGDSLDTARVAGSMRVRQLAQREVRRWLDAPTVRWLTREVLVRPDQHPAGRRAACAFVLAGERDDQLLLALSTCAREAEGPVREAALWSLAGWDEDSVHAMFLRLLDQEDIEAPSPSLGALEEHFGGTHLAPDNPTSMRLLSYVAQRITDENWRVAVHSIRVSSALDTSLVAPLLIEALEAWVARAESGQPVRRVQQDLSSTLEERSGLRLGAQPARWRTWWKGYEAGQRPLSSDDSGNPVSEASFFGIRPLTDRVVFLIDHSGSMDGRMPRVGGRSADEGWTRYEEAVAQMISLLEHMGPRTRFNVVTFDDEARSWHSRLQAATTSNLRAARTWALSRRPKGGTFLRAGFEEAIGLSRSGRFDVDEIEADTVIILCDGETAEGSSWVRPLLERVQSLRWLVHAVQLGTFGDDTLELLAERTGGDYVRL